MTAAMGGDVAGNDPAYIEIRLLRYFAVVAEEGSMRKAAERLFISQPPLSRQIRQLEDQLGVRLFLRSSTGLSLTEQGAEALHAIRPLLELQDKTARRLYELAASDQSSLKIGLTTAFEQGIFVPLESLLRQEFATGLRLQRGSSPRLAAEVRKGRLDAAFIALPLETQGLACVGTGYAEPLVAVVPDSWHPQEHGPVPLARLNDMPLFWFKREASPAFYDYSKAVFTSQNYMPSFVDEPAEHDVLLARIASGEAVGLMAASFAAIQRKGIRFVPLDESSLLRLELGLITRPDDKALPEKLLEICGAYDTV